MTPKILKETVIYKGWGRFLMLDIAMSSGEVIQRQLEDHGHAGVVLPYDPERRVALLVRQWRLGPLFMGDDPSLLEAPAGMIDPGEAGDEACRREAMEEAGVRIAALEPVIKSWSAPGISTETLDLYLAPFTAVDRIAAGGGAAGEHEEIEVVEMPLAELWRMAKGAQIPDLKTLLLIYVLHERRPDLF